MGSSQKTSEETARYELLLSRGQDEDTDCSIYSICAMERRSRQRWKQLALILAVFLMASTLVNISELVKRRQEDPMSAFLYCKLDPTAPTFT
jgi:hypothetical protein